MSDEVISETVFHEALELFHRYNPGTALWRGAEAMCFATAELIHPVLDIGCGDGAFGALITRLVKAVQGKLVMIDAGVDVRMTAFHHPEAYQRILEADAACLPFAGERFTTVISNCVMEHIVDIGSALKETNRVLKKGGRFYFTVPSDYFNQYFLCPELLAKVGMTGIADHLIKQRNRKLEHYNIHTIDTWRRILKENGFVLVTHRYIISRRMQRIVFIIYDAYNVGVGRFRIGSIVRTCEFLAHRLIHRRPLALLFHKLFQMLFSRELTGSMSEGGGIFFVAEKEHA